MAYKPTEQEKLQFIAEIAPLAQKAYKTLGKVYPSICIGMACIESGFGYGTDGSRLMYKHNAVLGQKVGTGKTATKYWGGKAFKASTKEEYQVGVHTTIPAAAFREYDNLEQCIFNYYELLNTSLYKKVTRDVDYATQMAQIKACGYMTSSTEVNSVINVIRQYNLNALYDGVQNVTPIVTSNGYVVGKTYTTNSDVYIRDAAAGEKIDWYSITTNAQLNAFTDAEGYSILRKGTRVTCKGIVEKNGQLWMHIPSGFIIARKASGQVYVE